MANTKMHWVGLALSVLAILFLFADGIASFLVPPALAKEMAATGWPLWTGKVVGAIAIGSAIIYAVPRTSVLGAILITGFLGGAISAHLRLGEIGSPPQLICLVAGIATWGGLWFRSAILRSLIPSVARVENAGSLADR